ncbi:hypothetical protein PPSIR1_30621 [Plesiocystis pacifica SIR-1]|uniref:Gamma-glutamylcyclotransferase n=1 Tax=Plesiocystis pacifica SIR-1 TaxID=391625 RepID=A6GAD7_9BACT|nr:gamma-glutamylcyclotransferase family protein [Plesiocystis pacifica]EDM77125.1 hypothetical protein PPSIR1_30621 [Plesiocystis pacifica SIR-1]
MADLGKPSVWRFGYASNISLDNLRTKKQLAPTRHLVGRVRGWALTFDLPGIPHVDPAFACVREDPSAVLHGAAFEVSAAEAEGLDRQEGGYDVAPVRFESYTGERFEGVGLYVPKPGRARPGHGGLPSKRYLRLIQRGAREAGLDPEHVARLDALPHHLTAPEVRAQSEAWIAEFEADPARRDRRWTAEELAAFDGSDPQKPAHTSALGYVVRYESFFRSWRGHTITRRNLLHVRGQSVDGNDIRHGQPGFHPLPRVADCSEDEREFLRQNLDHLLHGGGVIVGRLQDFLDAQ